MIISTQNRALDYVIPSVSSGRRWNIIKVITCVLAAFIAAFHITVLGLYNSLDNPIKFRFATFVNSYSTALVTQNWTFFAPDPIDSDVSLIARGQTATGPFTKWTEISEPFDRRIQQNRFSKDDLVDTALHNALVVSLAKDYRKSNLSDLTIKEHPEVVTLVRLAAAAMKDLSGSDSFKRIQIAIRVSEFPRFTHRFDPNSASTVRFNTLPAFSFPHDVTPIPGF